MGWCEIHQCQHEKCSLLHFTECPDPPEPTSLYDCCPICGHQFDLERLPPLCPVCRWSVNEDGMIKDGDDYAYCY